MSCFSHCFRLNCILLCLFSSFQVSERAIGWLAVPWPLLSHGKPWSTWVTVCWTEAMLAARWYPATGFWQQAGICLSIRRGRALAERILSFPKCIWEFHIDQKPHRPRRLLLRGWASKIFSRMDVKDKTTSGKYICIFDFMYFFIFLNLLAQKVGANSKDTFLHHHWKKTNSILIFNGVVPNCICISIQFTLRCIFLLYNIQRSRLHWCRLSEWLDVMWWDKWECHNFWKPCFTIGWLTLAIELCGATCVHI